MAVIVVAPHRGFLDGAVHVLDLTIIQGCLGLVSLWSMLFWAQAYSKAWARKSSPRLRAALEGPLDERSGGGGVAGRGEVDAVIGQNRVHPIGYGLDQGTQEVSGDPCRDLLMQFDVGDLDVRSIATRR